MLFKSVLLLFLTFFAFSANADEFECRPVVLDNGVQILGENIDSFLDRELKPYSEQIIITQKITLDDDGDKFAMVYTNLSNIFGKKPPFPIDTLYVFEMKEESRRKLFTIVYVYKDCVMNWSLIPDKQREKIFGQPI